MKKESGDGAVSERVVADKVSFCRQASLELSFVLLMAPKFYESFFFLVVGFSVNVMMSTLTLSMNSKLSMFIESIEPKSNGPQCFEHRD